MVRGPQKSVGWSEPAIFLVILVAISSDMLEMKPRLLCSVMSYFIVVPDDLE